MPEDILIVVAEPVKFGLSGRDRIMQRVRTILLTLKGSVPLDRSFGIDGRVIDRPDMAGRVAYEVDILDALDKYEPLVEATGVKWVEPPAEAMDGKKQAKVGLIFLE